MPETVLQALRKAKARQTPQKVEIVKHHKRSSAYGKVQRQPFKDRTVVNLVYTETLALATGAAGIYAEYLYNLNSIYDPNRTGLGHQPMGYDTYATLYSKYRVLKCSYVLDGISKPDNTSSIAISAVMNNHSTLFANFGTAIEADRSKYMLLGPTTDSKRIRGSADLAKLHGQKKMAYLGDTTVEAAIGASPAEVMALHIGVQGPDGVAVVANFVLKITYTVELFDPIQLVGS